MLPLVTEVTENTRQMNTVMRKSPGIALVTPLYRARVSPEAIIPATFAPAPELASDDRGWEKSDVPIYTGDRMPRHPQITVLNPLPSADSRYPFPELFPKTPNCPKTQDVVCAEKSKVPHLVEKKFKEDPFCS